MTPWGIRSRIKSALGLPAGDARQAGGRTADDTLAVEFVLPDGATRGATCEAKYTLVMASQTLETPIATGCPDGHCGGCRVQVLDGAAALAAPTAAEARLLQEKWPNNADYRLACHAKVSASGARVRVFDVWRMEQTRGE